MAFRRLVREALAAPLGARLAAALPAPCAAAIVADARGGALEDVALAEMLDALASAGVPRARAFVLLASDGGPEPALAVRARRERQALGVPVLLHDPDRSAHFRAGRGPGGIALELDDELREAEAVILVAARAEPRACASLLVPGLTSRATLVALRAAGADTLAQGADDACRQLGVDWALTWDLADPPRVRAGTGAAMLAPAQGAPGGP